MGNVTKREKIQNSVNANNAMEYYINTPNATAQMIKAKFGIRPKTDSNQALMSYLDYWGNKKLYEEFKEIKRHREWRQQVTTQQKEQYSTEKGDKIFTQKMILCNGSYEDDELFAERGTQFKLIG